MSAPLTPREVLTQWFQRVWIEHDESAITEFLSPHAIGEHEGGQISRGPEDFKAFFRSFVMAFPDVKVEVLDMVTEGGKVYVRWKARGTHENEAFGIAPTRRPHTFGGISWFEVADGQIVGGGDSWNLNGLLSAMAAP